MKIMIIGGGGREHAVVKALQKNPQVERIFVLPGNGGIATEVECINIQATDLDNIIKFAQQEQIDFAIVTPDDPLVMGAVDRLNEINIPCFGPTARAAAIEGSKVFSKNLMLNYNIPTATCNFFNKLENAIKFLNNAKYPLVVKADGLAAGKGVTIAHNKDEAIVAAISMMQDKIFGASGENIVVEEFLNGVEVSVLSFTDGKTIIPMISAKDHKRIYDYDQGPNTGGMGAIAPNPYYTKEIAAECMEKIFLPTIRAMNAEGRRFSGCLYFGLMLTARGPKVIEYNCRFGDPEAQVVLPLLESDLLEIMLAVSQGRLAETEVVFSNKAACCVVMASEGYPRTYTTGHEITINPDFPQDAMIFHAGTKLEDNKLVTAGGRVLNICTMDDSLEKAISKTYAAVDKVSFANAYWRKDIGNRR